MHAAYTLSEDPAALQLDVVHGYLTRSYWSPGISRDLVARAIAGSHCVGVYKEGTQVAFARVVTDHATFAHLADVFVLEDHQGRGLASAMLDHLHRHAQLQGLRRWTLNTRDAHSLYERHGWTRVTDGDPTPFMQRYDPDASRERRP